MTSNGCPNNTWNHTFGCTCVSNGSFTAEAADIDLHATPALAETEPATEPTAMSSAMTGSEDMLTETTRVVGDVLAEDPNLSDADLVNTMTDYWKGRMGKATHESLQHARWSDAKVPGRQASALREEFSWRKESKLDDPETAAHLRSLAPAPTTAPTPDSVYDPPSIPGGAVAVAADRLRQSIESGADRGRAYEAYNNAVRYVDTLTPGVSPARTDYDNAVEEHEWRKTQDTTSANGKKALVAANREEYTALRALETARERAGYEAPRPSTIDREMSPA